MSEQDKTAITQLLISWQDGNATALDELLPLVYRELKAISRNYLRGERRGHTLSATALVHEAYVKLIDQDRITWQNRAQFFAIISTLMRRTLLQYARTRNAQKRGSGEQHLTLRETLHFFGDSAEIDIIDLDTALTELTAMDERKGRIVEMRFFAGLTEKEIADVLAISESTVRREWRSARAWLYKCLRKKEEG